jgi:Carbohydrate binding module (family 6)
MEVVVIVLTMMRSLAVIMIAGSAFAQYPTTYKGTPYHGAPTNSQPQTIPGRIYMGYYDDGGEGVAYHDNDSINQGVPWGNFRVGEGVDVEWTKEDDYWADSAGNKVVPPGVYLIGWTAVGEWVNFTVNVQTAGLYTVSGMVSKDQGRIVRNFVLDNRDTIGAIDVAATGYWHLWRYYNNMIAMPLPAGKHLLKVYELGEGNMQYFDLALKGAGVRENAVFGWRSGRTLGLSFANGKVSAVFDVAGNGPVSANLYRTSGRLLMSGDKEYSSSGRTTIEIGAGSLAEGIYVVEILQRDWSLSGLLKIVR